MVLVEKGSATAAFDAWWSELAKQAQTGLRTTSRDGAVAGEILNAVTVLSDPTRGIVQSKIRNMPLRYAWGELLWYLSGSNRLSDISKFSAVWENLSDNGETINSAYGYRIFTKFGFDQWDYVKNLLIKDPESRRAVIHIKDANNEPSRDVPCTCTLQFLLRDNRLYLTTYMRSNDIWTGFPYDIFAFTSFQVLMAMELGVDLGEYTHMAGSLHLYERDWRRYEETKDPAVG